MVLVLLPFQPLLHPTSQYLLSIEGPAASETRGPTLGRTETEQGALGIPHDAGHGHGSLKGRGSWTLRFRVPRDHLPFSPEARWHFLQTV